MDSAELRLVLGVSAKCSVAPINAISLFAIKQLQVEATGSILRHAGRLLAEARIIKECRSSGVPSAFCHWFSTDYWSKRTVQSSRCVMETDISLVPVDHRISLLHQVSVGMSFLHGLDILHNDLKSMNVLLTQSGPNAPLVAKIADFGLSKMKNEIRSRSTVSRVGGSAFWMAPELTGFKKKITKANDVFSFAVLLTEVVSWVGVLQALLKLLLDGFDGAQAVASSVATQVFHPVASCSCKSHNAKIHQRTCRPGLHGPNVAPQLQLCRRIRPGPIAHHCERGKDVFAGSASGASTSARDSSSTSTASTSASDSAYNLPTVTISHSKPSSPPGPVDEILTDLALTHPDIVKFWRHWAVDPATGKTALQMPWSELAFALEATILDGDTSKEVKEDLLQEKCGKAFKTACPLSAFSVFVKHARPGSTVADVFGFAVGPTKQELLRIKERGQTASENEGNLSEAHTLTFEKEKQSRLEDKVKHRIVAGGWDQANCTFKELTEDEKCKCTRLWRQTQQCNI
ncbi:kinase-like domain-containing protein [Zopfochytrium polystomum]|nr:kinase-like domain-containing protein [Zopfochytrium polystomum]